MQKLLLLLGLFLVGCAKLPKATPPTSQAADTEFSRLSNDYIANYLAWRPQTGTALGLHQYDGKVTDMSAASIAVELSSLKKFDRLFASIATNQLSPQSFYDYRILRSAIQREIFGFEEMQNFTRNPMTYSGVVDVSIYIKRDFGPLGDRVRSVIAILNQTTNILTAARANLADSLPRTEIETAIEEATGAADFLGKDLVEALKGVKNEKLMAEFNAANGRAIAELRGYVSYLNGEKLPKANDDFALGREKYVHMLVYGEMVTASPEELLEIGLRELKVQQRAFADAAREIDPEKKPAEVFKAIQKEHPTAPNLIPDTARDLEAIRHFVIDRKIVTLPSRVRAKVKETPQFLRATSFASMDTPGPFETRATEAYYYVTPAELDWPPQQQDEWLTAFSYYDIAVTSIHEAYPGHYVQYLCLNASPATKLEKIFTSYAFSEGWAHYTEQMMLDEGFGVSAQLASTRDERVKAAKYRLAQADEALLRICRLCVSIRMHCQGMTVDEATAFFEENCYYKPKPARDEAVRGTYDPEYLYYTLGKLEILKLREDYRKQEGLGFKLEKFHNELLRHGSPPIRLLREVMLKDSSTWGDVF